METERTYGRSKTKADVSVVFKTCWIAHVIHVRGVAHHRGERVIHRVVELDRRQAGSVLGTMRFESGATGVMHRF